MNELKCLKCEHTWTTKRAVEEVKICPKCKTKYWNNAEKLRKYKKKKEKVKPEKKTEKEQVEELREQAMKEVMPDSLATPEPELEKERERIEKLQEKAVKEDVPIITATQGEPEPQAEVEEPEPEPEKKPKPKSMPKQSNKKFKLDVAKRYRSSGDDELERITNEMMDK